MALQYVLTGFTQDSGCRVFAFARIEEDRTRTDFTVRADLALSRRYMIPMQELPLLCRNFLARREDLGNSRAVIFNEDEMRLYATNCATAKQAAANKRKPAHRPVSGNLGAAWRGHTRQDAAQAPGTAPELSPGAGDAHEEVATAAAAPAGRDSMRND